MDYFPLFQGKLSEHSTLNTHIVHTPIGTMVAGLLGNDEMIRKRYSKIANLMACDSMRASVSFCSTYNNGEYLSDFVEDDNETNSEDFLRTESSSKPCFFEKSSNHWTELDIPSIILNQLKSEELNYEIDDDDESDKIPGVVNDACDDDFFHDMPSKPGSNNILDN